MINGGRAGASRADAWHGDVAAEAGLLVAAPGAEGLRRADLANSDARCKNE